MAENWRSKYTELKEFIAKSPQIKIDQESISIPKDYRKEFYHLFDLVRSAFVEEEYPGFLERARPMCMNYIQAEKEIIEN